MSSAPQHAKAAASGGSATQSYSIPTQLRSDLSGLQQQDWSVVERMCQEYNMEPGQLISQILHNAFTNGADIGFTVPKGT